MRLPSIVLALAVLAPFARAQDKITLSNGDVLTGTIKTMNDGKLTVTSPVLGDVTVDLAKVTNIATQDAVELETKNGDRFHRRITGIDGGKLSLAGEGLELPSLSIEQLGRINPPAQEPVKWTGSVALNAGLTSGNTDRRAIGAAANAERRTTDDRITADAAWDYAEDHASGAWTLTQRRVGAGLKYDYFVSKKSYFLVTTRVLGDTLADIQLRYTAGAGYGLQWIETDTLNVLTEAGLSYFNTNYRSATPAEDYLAARVAYKVNWLFSPTTRLIHSVEAFPSVERAEDIYLQADTKLQTNLTESMIAQLQWVWDYDNTPAPGRDRSDHRLLLSVGWTF